MAEQADVSKPLSLVVWERAGQIPLPSQSISMICGDRWTNKTDTFLSWTEQKDANVVDYALGEYVIKKAGGIRTHPYSTSA